jgi:hypothetical protein
VPTMNGAKVAFHWTLPKDVENNFHDRARRKHDGADCENGACHMLFQGNPHELSKLGLVVGYRSVGYDLLPPVILCNSEVEKDMLRGLLRDPAPPLLIIWNGVDVAPSVNVIKRSLRDQVALWNLATDGVARWTNELDISRAFHIFEVGRQARVIHGFRGPFSSGVCYRAPTDTRLPEQLPG